MTIKKTDRNVKLDINTCELKQFAEFSAFSPRAGYSHVVGAAGSVYIYGGQSMEGLLGEFLLFDSKKHSMSKITKEKSPGVRNASAMAYSKENGAVFLFGGADETGPLGDLWSFDEKSQEWREIDFKVKLPEREMAGLSYFEEGKGLLIAGGRNSEKILDSIVLVNPLEGTWKEISSKLPSPLCAFGFTSFDSGSILAFYGGTDGTGFSGELIIYEAASEKTKKIKIDAEVTNETGDIFGGGVIAPSIAYNELSGRLLLFGGSSIGQESSSLYLIGKEKWSN